VGKYISNRFREETEELINFNIRNRVYTEPRNYVTFG